MIATALTAEQAQLHADHLVSVTNFRVFPLLVETVLYSIFTVLIVIASYILVVRGLSSRSSKIMLAVTLIMYGLATWDWAVEVHLLRDDLKLLLPADLIQPPPDNQKRLRINTALRISQSIMNNLCVMLGDMVVCWRVYVVYVRNKRVLFTALVLLTLVFTALLLCNLTQIGIGFPSVGPLHLLAPGEMGIDIVALSLSALINIWATGMIVAQAWYCRQMLKSYLRTTTRRTFAESMLILFAESGVVYTTVWILKNILIIPAVEPTPYTAYATVIMNQVVGMYPTIIIILVALNKSHLDREFRSSDDATKGSMIFASGPTSAARTLSVSPRTTKASSESRSDIIDITPDSKTQLESTGS
ncbi:hypothetical protein DFH09DRAFT_397258 [Mycena vulgaris]|nr:hypothetical protein DFH09DRAFT_397258 [Mycena vulgaris]